MASVEKVESGWRARWRTPAGESRSKTFARKVDADRHLTAVEASKLTGGYVDSRAGRISFAEYAEGWLASRVHRPATAARVAGDLRVHVLP